MNELLDRLFEMPARQRVLLLVAVVFLLFAAYASLSYWPRQARIGEKEDELAGLRLRRDRQATLIANMEEARKQVEELKAALNEAVAQLPDTKEIPDLLSGISAVARDAGLEIAQFRQRPEVFHEFYAEVPVEILVRGTYFQVESFFRQVSQLTRIVNIGNVGLKGPGTVQNDPVQLSTACTATTFRFLDEAERERIAKQREKEAKR